MVKTKKAKQSARLTWRGCEFSITEQPKNLLDNIY